MLSHKASAATSEIEECPEEDQDGQAGEQRRGEGPCPSGPPVDHYKPSGRKYSKKELNDRLTYAEAKDWLLAHKRQLSPLPLPEATERLLRQWFELVDDDGSGQLNASELEFALKASGIPADSNAILEVIKLFDFDRDGEIAWREFHNFISHEVLADKDPLGAEYVLPSGMALPLGSMIGTIRRRKMLKDVEKGGTSRDFWAAEGPEFLRYLLESEHYAFDRHGTSREVLLRILAYKPPPSQVADPNAVEEHKRRIERLKLMLTRTASERPPDKASVAGKYSSAGAEDGASASGPTAASLASFGMKPRSSTLDGVPSPGQNDSGPAGSPQWRLECAGLGRRPTSARPGAEGSSGVQSTEASRRVARAQVRFAAVLAAAKMALAEAQAAQDELASPGVLGGGCGPGAGSAGTQQPPTGTRSPCEAEAQPAATSESPTRTSNEGSGSNNHSAAGDELAVEMAAAILGEMRRLEDALEQHRQRTGGSRPRVAQVAGNSLSNPRASHARQPVVVPVRVAAAVDDLLQPASGRATADGCGSVLSDAGNSWTAGSGHQLARPAGNGTGGSDEGGGGGWVATAGRRQAPLELRVASGGDGGDASGWVVNAVRWPVPPPPRVPRTSDRGGGSGMDPGGEGPGDAGGSGWVVSRGRRPTSLRTSLEQPGRGIPPQGSRMLPAADGNHGDGNANVPSSGLADGNANVPSSGLADTDAAAATEVAYGQFAVDEEVQWELTMAASSPPSSLQQKSWVPGAHTGAHAGGIAKGTNTADAQAAAAAASHLSSPQPRVPRLNSTAGERSLSTGRGPYSATLIRSARASSRALALGTPRCTGTGEVSLSGGRAATESSMATAVVGATSSGASFGASDTSGAMPSNGSSQRTSTGETAAARCVPHHRSVAALRAASFTQPYPHTPNGKVEAAASAAEIRRMAWSSQLYSQQRGGWPQASPSLSTCTSAPGAAAAFTAGQVASSASQFASGAALIPSSRGPSARASGIPFRRSVDLGEYSTERVSARSGVSTGTASAGAVATAAAAAAWLGATRPGLQPNPEAPPPLTPRACSLGSISLMIQPQQQPQPQPQGVRVQMQGLAPGPGAAQANGVQTLLPSGQSQLANLGQDSGTTAWTAAAPRPPPAHGPVPARPMTAAPPQSASAAVVSANIPDGRARRSLEMEPRASGHTCSGPSSAPPANPQVAANKVVKESGFAWMRGRLMKTCLAASLRVAAESSTLPPPSSYNQSAAGAVLRPSEGNTVGVGSECALPAANGQLQVRPANGQLQINGQLQVRPANGQLQINGQLQVRPATGAFTSATNGDPTDAQHEDGSRRNLTLLFAKPSSLVQGQVTQQEARVPAGGEKALLAEEPASSLHSRMSEVRWPWPWKGDLQVVGTKGGSRQSRQLLAPESQPVQPRTSVLRRS